MKTLLLLTIVALSLVGDRPGFAAEVPSNLRIFAAVPEEAAFSAVLRNFADRRQSLTRSAMFGAILETPFARQLASSPEFAKLVELESHILGELQTTRAEVLDDVFGDLVVFSWLPAFAQPAEKPALDRGLFLFALRRPEKFDRLLDRIHAAQKTSGELKELREIDSAGIRYWHRVKARGPDEYCIREGGVFVHSSDAKLLETTVARLRRTKADDKPAFAVRLKTLGLDDDLFVWWIDPRRFDGEFAASLKKAGVRDRLLIESVLGQWPAITDLWVRFDTKTSLELVLGMRTDPSKRPPAASAPRIDLWSAIPADSLFAVAGSLDLVQILRDLGELMPPEDRKKAREGLTDALDRIMGKGHSELFEAGLGRSWGMWARPPGPDAGWFPSMVWAIPLSDAPEGAKTGELVYDSLSLLGGLLRLNNAAIVSEREKTPEGEIRFLKSDKLFPSGFQPSWGVRGQFFAIASSPETLRSFAAPKPAIAAEEAILARVSFAAWGTFLDGRLPQISTWLATTRGVPLEPLKRDLTEFRLNVAPFDKLELKRTFTREQFRLTLTLTPAIPVKESRP